MGKMISSWHLSAMALLNGLLNLGSALSGLAVITPGSGAGYTALPISYDTASGGLLLSSVNCVFGPASGWGTLSVFNVTDLAGNPVWAGTLSAPITPQNGSLVIIPVGNLQLITGQQLTVNPASNWFAQQPFLAASLLAGNPLPVPGGLSGITPSSGLVLTSGGLLYVSLTSGNLTSGFTTLGAAPVSGSKTAWVDTSGFVRYS
jgi:hypothetical protein